MSKIVILDYMTLSVDVWDHLPEFEYSDEIEEYISDTLGYSLDSISWMETDDNEVPVYVNGDEKPKLLL